MATCRSFLISSVWDLGKGFPFANISHRPARELPKRERIDWRNEMLPFLTGWHRYPRFVSATLLKVLELSFHTSTHGSSLMGNLPPFHSEVRYVTGFLHQLDGACRSRLDRAFERFGIPNVTSHDGQHFGHTNRCPQENIPNEKTVEFGFGRLRISIFIQDRLDVERGEYRNDENVHCLESKLFARANPRGYKYDYSPPWEARTISLTSSQTRILCPPGYIPGGLSLHP